MALQVGKGIRKIFTVCNTRKFRDSLSMPPDNSRPADRIVLTVPVIFLVLAATAIPIEFRPLGGKRSYEASALDDAVRYPCKYYRIRPRRDRAWRIRTGEGDLHRWLVLDVCRDQPVVIMLRDSSITDLVSNVVGATLGSLVSARWNIVSPAFRISRWKAMFAVLLGLVLVLDVWTGLATLLMLGKHFTGNSRSVLETRRKRRQCGPGFFWPRAAWQICREPKRIAGVMGHALVFDGTNYLDFGHSTGLRLAGSMTISLDQLQFLSCR